MHAYRAAGAGTGAGAACAMHAYTAASACRCVCAVLCTRVALCAVLCTRVALTQGPLRVLSTAGKVSVQQLQSVPGLEAQVADSQLDDLDEDEDGLVDFDAYLTTYSKPRKVWLNIVVMAINTALIYLLLSSPLDVFIKSVATLVLVLKPQIVNRPVIKIYDIVETMLNRGKAEMALRSA